MPDSGSCDVTLGYPAVDGEKMTNAKFRQLGVPAVRVGEGAIGERELNKDDVRNVLLKSPNFKTQLFFDGKITAGSTILESASANFEPADIGRRIVSIYFPAGAKITSGVAGDGTRAVIDQPAGVRFFDGALDADVLTSEGAQFTSDDQGRTVTGPNFGAGTTIDTVDSPTQVTLNQAGTDGVSLEFQINGRVVEDVTFQIANRGVGWKLWLDDDGVGYAEIYGLEAIFSGDVQNGPLSIRSGELSIGSPDFERGMFTRSDGGFTWGKGARALNITGDGRFCVGGDDYQSAPTKIANTGDVTIQDLLTSNHNIATGAVNPAVHPVYASVNSGIIYGPTAISFYCATHYAQIYYRVTAPDGVTTNGSPTFTTATGNFTVRDIGKLLVGSNLGSPIPAGTRIKSVTNATTVVLTNNATADGTGVEYYIRPDTTDTLWDGNPITISATRLLNINGYKSGHYSTEVAAPGWSTYAYTYSGSVTDVPPPGFSPAVGMYGGTSLDVTIACALAGSKIAYTTDGTDPTVSGTTVTNGTLIDAASGVVTLPQGTTTIKAMAFKSGLTASGVTAATYEVSPGSSEQHRIAPGYSESETSNTVPAISD